MLKTFFSARMMLQHNMTVTEYFSRLVKICEYGQRLPEWSSLWYVLRGSLVSLRKLEQRRALSLILPNADVNELYNIGTWYDFDRCNRCKHWPTDWNRLYKPHPSNSWRRADARSLLARARSNHFLWGSSHCLTLCSISNVNVTTLFYRVTDAKKARIF